MRTARGIAPLLRVTCSVALAAARAASGAPPAIDARPDIVLVVLDTVRASAVSLEPGSRKTPNLARLAERGVRFEQAYATHDNTRASHFSLFTGLYDGVDGARDVPENSLVHHLRRAGYRSVGVSANGNVFPDGMASVRPFERFENLYRAEPREVADPWVAQMLERYRVRAEPHVTGLLRARAARVVERVDALLEGVEGPRFVFVNFMDAHDPYLPPADFHALAEEPPLAGFDPDLRGRETAPELRDPSRIRDAARRAHVEQLLRWTHGRAWQLAIDLPPAHLRRYEARYLAEMRGLDADLEGLWQVLRRRALFERSLVIVVSDHGECFGERDLVTHGHSDAGDPACVHHVPLLVLTPSARAQHRVARRVSIADLAPTVYALVGIDDTAWRRSGLRYGTSLAGELGLAAPAARLRLEPRTGAPDLERDRAAEERLRALGYVE